MKSKGTNIQKSVQPPLGTGLLKNNPGMNTTTLNTPSDSFVSSIDESIPKRFESVVNRSNSPDSELKYPRVESPDSIHDNSASP